MAQTNRIREGSRVADVIIYIVLGIICLVTLYPMYYVFILSISDPLQAASMQVYLYPKGFYLDSYKLLFQDSSLWRSYLNTLLYVVSDTVLMLVVCTLCAYPLTSNRLIGRKVVTIFLLIPMYFSGGLVPSYILVNSLHLTNTRWAMIIPSAMSTYNMIICRTYMSNSIPDEMYEAAQIDGCTPWKYFLRIVTPLCKPILAVLTLYYGVAKWNDYYTAMIYLRDDTLMPLTIVMKEILIQNKVDMTQIGDASNLAKLQGMSELLKYSTIVVASIPVMLLYPLVQKHLVKGVMIGAVKG